MYIFIKVLFITLRLKTIQYKIYKYFTSKKKIIIYPYTILFEIILFVLLEIPISMIKYSHYTYP